MLHTPVHVLVVDRAGDERDRVCGHLADLGLRYEAVASGADTLDVLDWWRPVIVIIEHNLDDGSGVGLTGQVRAWADAGYLPLFVILHSHHEAPEGHDLYLAKPATRDQLDRAIDSFLAA